MYDQKSAYHILEKIAAILVDGVLVMRVGFVILLIIPN